MINDKMPKPADPMNRTRATLIHRLKNWQDAASWQEFFDTYWRLIYSVAYQAGMTDAEAQDVVQETMIAVARHMPKFTYDPSIGSFKSWLLNMTRWRVLDQFRKRNKMGASEPKRPKTDTTTTAIEKIADPSGVKIDEIWEKEWQQNLLAAALENVKRRIDPEKFQVFDFYVNKDWPPEKVAKSFNISVDQVYVAKHRITQAIKDEVERLEKKMT
jgi:RNA polymerase sigma factor (sigma-70 family)